MKRPVIFFDLGQTLVNEWDFINYFDEKFLEILNGFGARIDSRNYQAVRDNVIRNRQISNGSVKELVIEVCKLICQAGYDKIIAQRLEPQIKEGRKKLFRIFDDAEETLNVLAKRFDLGIIANQTKDIVRLLDDSNISRFFKVKVISSEVGIEKPDPRIFQLAMHLAKARNPKGCIMVGDRLDTDILPANLLGMTTIRTTNSLFKLQEPMSGFERPRYTISSLSEIPYVLKQSL
ncbi:MAG TPA: HAD family hydrolase [Candidatus Bathyarchaeia archaeon]|nr:HAD family hydrolase [Candidatus Bathyarchaeia archaeon]